MKIANALIVLMLAAGCGPDPQASELESQIKQLTAQRDDAQASLDAAEGEANRLRRQLAAKERQRVEAVREASDLREGSAQLRKAFATAQKLAVGTYIVLKEDAEFRRYMSVALSADPLLGPLAERLADGNVTVNQYRELVARVAQVVGEAVVQDYLFPPDFELRIDRRGNEEIDALLEAGTGISAEDSRRRAQQYRDADLIGKALMRFDMETESIENANLIISSLAEAIRVADGLSGD